MGRLAPGGGDAHSGGKSAGAQRADADAEPGESYVLLSMNGQLRTTDYGDMARDAAMLSARAWGCADLQTALTTWRTINTRDLPAFNAVLARNDLRPIPAAAELARPVCGPAATSARSARRP